MVYLFFLFSLVSPFLFISPKNFHAPFQKGVFLFILLLTIISFWKEKKSKDQKTSFELLSEIQISYLPYLIWISCIFFLLGSTYHAFQLTKAISEAFLFQDADYIGISDILLSISKGEGFSSGYYSDSGKASYLHHHFAPGLLVLTPFVSWIPQKWGLAVAVFFVYQLATILWIFWAYQIAKKNLKTRGIQFLVFWVLVTNQLYLYRLGSSFHFEVLVLVFGLFFFYIWEQRKEIENTRSQFLWTNYSLLILSTILYLSQKEDIGIYLLLFFLPRAIKLLYNQWKKNRNTKQVTEEPSSTTEDRVTFRLLILIFSIIFLWFGFVFFLYPRLDHLQESITWTNVLTQEYHSAFKQVTGYKKSFQIFLELIISGGLGMIQMLPEVLGIGLIYATHIFSSRPWHHEVYTYYSYSLVPFILYTGILWIQSGKKITTTVAFFLLTCLFWKNSLDQNFPLNTKIESPWKNPVMQEEIQSDLQDFNQILLSNPKEPFPRVSKKTENSQGKTNPLQSFNANESTKEIFVFSQYNLSFFVSDKVKTYPIEQIKNAESICERANVCYMAIAPEFTDTLLWPSSRILEYKKKLENKMGFLVWKGKQIEVWQLPEKDKKTNR
ncbi:DUF2079 domain-containing protein [Leptospira brenneri]|uniref:DUF2079 domain-containing protein n=1 Tax=Leptospira brenneri TaxID=2023182 RepID=A0A2M9Y579_9LEPT|nr:DUF2079 domain-containing protein [Leptospira brenneri]PJZ46715.1 DUF2079 domain-containing protein [Leptospira brenneri]TGK96832.1 DUF2079 domain-containing protein [Leptospira brenneri]